MHRMDDNQDPEVTHLRALRPEIFFDATLPDLLVMWDLDQKPLYVNPAVEHFMGCSPAEFRKIKRIPAGHELESVLEPESFARFKAAIGRNLAADDSRSDCAAGVELELVLRDGTRLWTATRCCALRDSHGNRIGLLSVTSDITLLKETLAILRQSRTQYEITLDAMRDCIHVVDSNLDIMIFNRAFREWCERFDLPTDVIGRNLAQSYPFLTPEIVHEYEEVLARGEIVVTRETNILNGREYVAESKKIPVVKNGRVIQIVTVMHDITASEQARDRMQESEQRLGTVFRMSPDSITISCMSDGRIVEVNESACRMSGYERDELVGVTSETLAIWENPGERRRWIAELEREGEVRNWETTFVGKDGSRLPMLVSCRVIKFNGQPHLLNICRDIGEWKQARQILRESERKYRLLAENITDTVWMMDENLKFTYVSPSVERFRGFKPREIMEMSLEQNLLPDSLARFKEAVLSLAPDRTQSIEVEKYCKDGTTVWGEITLSPLVDEKGRPVGTLGVSRDIMERKVAERQRRELEAQLVQAQKMEALGTMAGGIAHDFNNILGAIMGYSEIARLKLPPDSPAAADLQKALGACERARDLANQILTFSRHEDHKLQPMQLAPIVKEALKLLRSSLPASIEIRQDIQATSTLVETDPTQIHQILMNLCTNAAHAMQKTAGVLEVGLTGAVLDGPNVPADMHPGNYLVLRVSDSGHGMSPDIIEHIYEPYFTTKRAGEGTGLGLAVIHGIVRRHGGGITVESTPGRGTTFCVYLPCAAALPVKPGPHPSGPAPRGHERILFVDDEQNLVEIGSQMLTHLGYEVTGHTSSIEALANFRSCPQGFDLVMSDLTMPDMGGSELAARIMEIRPEIPVVICTGFCDCLVEETARRRGIRKIARKPLTIGGLATELRAILDA